MADRLSSVLDVLDQRLAAGKITQADHLVQCEKAIAAFSAAQGPAKAEKEGLGSTIGRCLNSRFRPAQAGPGWPRLAQLGSGHFCSFLTKKGYEKGPNMNEE